MKASLQVAMVVLTGLACSSGAWAQRGFHRVAGASAMTGQRGMPIVMRAHVPTTQTPRVVTTTVNGTTSNAVFVSGASPLSLQDLLNPVPGFGFDFVHLAAINRNLGVRALIDPVTQMQLALAERLLSETPVTPAVFPVFGGVGEAPVIIPQQQPQVIILQQPAPAAEPVAGQPAPQPAANPEVAGAPLPDVGEFILVERDGSQVLAVAFTRQNDRIVYVTRQGIRRSMGITELDPDATFRVNEERGTSLQLPL